MNSPVVFREEYWLFPVLAMQTCLRYISRFVEAVPAIVPDNIFGPETRDAVQAFQQVFALPVTGVIDYVTWEMIIYIYDQLWQYEQLNQPQ